MKRTILLLTALVSLLMLVIASTAQEITPREVPGDDLDIAISFPPPVWVLSDSVQIIGTADLLNLSNYLIEYQELRFDTDEDEPTIERWFPATLPASQAVRNGVLGTWNTSTVRDGLYEIRLVINLTDGTQEIFEVGPLRVENDPQDDVAGLPLSTLQPTPTNLPGGGTRPTLAPTPTNIGGSGDPVVRALLDANIRSGDDTSYPRIDALFEGQQAPVLGISSTGSGWYYIEAPNGRRGFIAPSTVDFTGNIASLNSINPPPPPTPPATATPITTANLLVSGIELEPFPPVCNETFDIFINVTNNGTGPTNSSGTLTVIDRNNRTGNTTATTIGGFPIINPGGNFVVVASLTVDTYYNEDHTVIITVDSNGEIPETNEGDNVSSVGYELQQGDC